jgi:hypothetical protein
MFAVPELNTSWVQISLTDKNFDFIYQEVKDTYGDNGNVSIPPPVILKMMLLLVLYNVRSEREHEFGQEIR